MKPYIKYSQEIANEICQSIATSTIGLKKLCSQNPHWPDKKNIYQWCFERQDFRDQYAQAKSLQVDWLAEEALEVATDKSNDERENTKGDPVFNNAAVNRDRLIVDTIKWAASKLQPKKYGTQPLEVGINKSFLEVIKDKL